MSFDNKAQTKKGIEDWNAAEVVAWIEKEYASNEARKNKLVNAITENGYTGGELLSCENVAELQEALQIGKIMAKGLYDKMITVKESAIDDIVNKCSGKKSADTEKQMSFKDLDTLIEMFAKLFPETEREDIKDESKENNDEFRGIIEMIREIAEKTKNFVKSIIALRLKIKRSVSDEIIHICFEYYELLKQTSRQFLGYGADIHQLRQCLSQISYLYLLPSSIMIDLEQLDKVSQQKAINKLREQISEGLKSSCKHFHKSLDDIDKTHVPQLKELSEKWLALSKRILKLLKEFEECKSKLENTKDANEKYEKVNDILNGIRNVSKAAGGFCLKYLAAPLTFALPSALSAVAAGTISQAALLKCSRRIFNDAAKMRDKGDSMIKEVVDEVTTIVETKQDVKQIEIMKEALQRMASISQHMSTIMTLEVNNFKKLQEWDPHKVITFGGGGGYGQLDSMFMNTEILKKMTDLGESILNCTKCLEKSRKNIEIVEIVCEEEMKYFGKHIYEPLIKMVTNDGN